MAALWNVFSPAPALLHPLESVCSFTGTLFLGTYPPGGPMDQGSCNMDQHASPAICLCQQQWTGVGSPTRLRRSSRLQATDHLAFAYSYYVHLRPQFRELSRSSSNKVCPQFPAPLWHDGDVNSHLGTEQRVIYA